MNLQNTTPLLVLGWGNLSRGDDALGPLCVAALQDNLPNDLRAQIQFLDDYQPVSYTHLDVYKRQD